jgi:hypothetical protein
VIAEASRIGMSEYSGVHEITS